LGPRCERAEPRGRRRRARTWAALRDVYAGAYRQPRWVHAVAKVHNSLPRRLQPGAKSMLDEIIEAPTRSEAGALERFRDECDAGCQRALSQPDVTGSTRPRLRVPRRALGRSYQPTAIESSFATVKLRPAHQGRRVDRRRARAGVQLLNAAQVSWRGFTGHGLVTDVPAGAKFSDGINVTDDHDHNEMTGEGHRTLIPYCLIHNIC
jgi:hypothetical protein